jgi:hypothetical protein
MRKYRTLVRAKLSPDSRGFAEVVVPGWNSTAKVMVGRLALPNFVWDAMVTGSKYFYARVHLAAENSSELQMSDWEVGAKQELVEVGLEIGRYYLYKSSGRYEQYIGYDPHAKEGPRWGFKSVRDRDSFPVTTWLLEQQVDDWMDVTKSVCAECYENMTRS